MTNKNRQRAEQIKIALEGLYPKTFKHWRCPLKTGIRLEILADPAFALLGIEEKELSIFFRWYTSARSYLIAVRKGGARIGLDGLPSGEVTLEEIASAKKELKALELKRAKQRKDAEARAEEEAKAKAKAAARAEEEAKAKARAASIAKPVPGLSPVKPKTVNAQKSPAKKAASKPTLAKAGPDAANIAAAVVTPQKPSIAHTKTAAKPQVAPPPESSQVVVERVVLAPGSVIRKRRSALA